MRYLLVCFLGLSLFGCDLGFGDDAGGGNGGGRKSTLAEGESHPDILDQQSWYTGDNTELVKIEVTSLKAEDGSTMADVDADTDPYDDNKPVVPITLKMDGYKIPEYASAGDPVADIRQRGKSGRSGALKSYRVRFRKAAESGEDEVAGENWRHQRTLQINKHNWDISRIRNKLTFDILQEVPHITSLRTLFVNLWIDGKDFGLYTHIEHVGRHFLDNRGYGSNGHLYKADAFRFLDSPEMALDEDGEPLDNKAFNKTISVKRGGKDHSTLVAFIKGINSETDIDEVVTQYLSRDNYLTWMAVNIVTGNSDTNSQNFYLYNPEDTDVFYFLPWDYDGAWGLDKQIDYAINGTLLGRWQQGMTLLWSVPLHKKFLSKQKNRDDLVAMIDDIRGKYFSDKNIKKYLDAYKPIVKDYMSRDPDLKALVNAKTDDPEEKKKVWEKEFDELPSRVASNVDELENRMQRPTPFYQAGRAENGKIIFTWDESISFNEGDTVVYDLQMSSTPDFSGSLSIDETGLTDNRFETSMALPSGDNYFKVIARVEGGDEDQWQESFDVFMVQEGHRTVRHFGVRKFGS